MATELAADVARTTLGGIGRSVALRGDDEAVGMVHLRLSGIRDTAMSRVLQA